MTHRQRVAAHIALALLIFFAWLAWWANGAPAWTLPAVFGAVGLLLASASRGWRETRVAARTFQASDDHREPPLHIVRGNLTDREAAS